MSVPIKITLPDGAEREVTVGTTGVEVVVHISRSLAKSTSRVKVQCRGSTAK